MLSKSKQKRLGE